MNRLDRIRRCFRVCVVGIAVALICQLGIAPAFPEAISSFKLMSVKLKGLKHIDRKALEKMLAAKQPARLKFWIPKPVLTEEDLVDDIRKIEQYYKAVGFFNVKATYALEGVKPLSFKTQREHPLKEKPIQMVPSHQAKVVFTIEEGVPVLVQSIRVQIKDAPAVFSNYDFLSRIPLKQKARFEIENYKESKALIQKLFGNFGYPLAAVTSAGRVDLGVNQAEVIFTIEPGPQCTFGPMQIAREGVAAKEKIVRRAITYKTGEPYDTRKVVQSQRNLYDLDVFKTALIKPGSPESEKNTVPMTLTLKLKKRQSLKFGLGYGSEDGVRVKGGWVYRNPGGWAGRFTMDAKHSNLYQGISGAYRQPYFWDAKNSLTAVVGTEKETLDSYDGTRTYGNMSLNRKIYKHWQMRVGYNFEMSRIEDLNLTDPEELIEFQRDNDFLISSFMVGAVLNITDNEISPTRGQMLSLSLEAASGAFGSSISFLSPELEFKTFHPLTFQTTLACRFQARSIQEIEDTDHIPIFKRLFLGGGATVRGYRYQKLGPLDDNGNPLGGLTALNANMELRRHLYKSISGVLFLDMGLIEDNAFEYNLNNLRFGSGFGLRYDTPVGPLRVDLGVKLNPETSQEEQWRVHFSIGQAF